VAYKSLKDIYSLAVRGIHLQPLGRQLLAEQLEVKKFIPTDAYVGNQTWSSYGVSPALFNEEAKKGQGRGEYSVACILWGLKNKMQVEQKEKELGVNIVQGGAKSFDVLGEDRQQYEVKEIGKSVRTGVEGKKAIREILDEVATVLTSILNAYTTMDEHGKQTVNNSVINSNVVRRDIINNTNNASYFNKIKNTWTLDSYLDNILHTAKGGELSRGILLSRVLRLSYYAKARPVVIFSLKQLAEVLEEISNNDISMSDQPGQINTAVKDIYNTINKHYKINDSEDEKGFFEREAENIDRDLTQKQCKVFKKCTNESSFKKVISSLQLKGFIDKIESMTKNIITRLFPGNGLFLVDASGFDYIPRDLLGEYIEFDTISGSGPKIKKKKISQTSNLENETV